MEDGFDIGEVDAVLPDVGSILGRIEGDLHGFIVCI